MSSAGHSANPPHGPDMARWQACRRGMNVEPDGNRYVDSLSGSIVALPPNDDRLRTTESILSRHDVKVWRPH